MWRWSRTLAASVVVTVTMSATANATSSATTPADDQAAADVAIGGFDTRMTAAGWIRQPPQPLQSLEESHVNLGEVVVEDPMSCLDPDRVFSFEHPLEGETARALSAAFLWNRDEDVVADPTAFAGTRLAFAAVATVDATRVGVLDGYIDGVASKLAFDCLDTKFTQAVAAAPESNGPFAAPEPLLAVDPDLAVGDHSSGVSMGLISDAGPTLLGVELRVHVARIDRSLVVVIFGHFGTGERPAVDSIDELAAIVDSLSGQRGSPRR